MILLHGTTRQRANSILMDGPNPHFHEPGAQEPGSGFSMTVESGPFYFGTPEDYARGKDREFRNEGGPAILVVDVPDDLVQLAVNDWFPLNQGLVQFDLGAGLEELIVAWPALVKYIRILNEYGFAFCRSGSRGLSPESRCSRLGRRAFGPRSATWPTA